MSSAEVVELHHFAGASAGLYLDIITPPNSATPSIASHSFLQSTHPPTPQDYIHGNAYFYSPAQTPYTHLEGSPVSGQQQQQQGFENNYELRFHHPRFMKEEDMAMLQAGGGGYMVSDYHGLNERLCGGGGHIYETWDETVGHPSEPRHMPSFALPPEHSQLDCALPSPTPSDDIQEPLRRHRERTVMSSSNDDKLAAPSPSKPKPCRAPRKRKAAGEKAERPKLPKLTKPLSELTREYHHLPVRNMENWVMRTAETRWKEVEKRGGYVTRPMNSFMLYRSAFAERTKLWCLQNNHQVVSSVSGESWPLEPPQIREKYNELAKIERMNHQAAHPGYKFSPSKAAQTSRKRKGSEGAVSAISDLDDGTIGLGSPPKKPTRSAKRSQKSLASNTNAKAPLVYMGFPYDGETGGAHRSSFNHNNPGKTPPMCMGTQDMSGQYYQTTVCASSTTPIPNPMPSTVIEDVTIRKTQTPTSLQQFLREQHHQQQQLIKMEGQEEEDNSKVDPMLLGGGGSGGADEERYMQEGCHHHHQQQQQYASLLPSHYLQQEPSPSGTGGFELLFPSQEMGGFPRELLGGGSGGSDVSKLPGYSEGTESFLDPQGGWSKVRGSIGGDGGVVGGEGGELCYDEWLQ